MYVERVEVRVAPGFTENCYLVGDTSDAKHLIVVDPGAQARKIRSIIGDRTVDTIVLTHCHFDHTGAVAALVKATGAEVVIHALDLAALSEPPVSRVPLKGVLNKKFEVTRTVEEGDTIAVGAGQLLVLHTPGHTIGSMCLYDEEGSILIAGDTLFYQAVGRTDLPTGDAAQQYESLKKLAQLPDETTVHPGHDADTSIGHEKQYGHLRLFVQTGGAGEG
jgi:glyoxylase-like metal-dependent hydrolase (beta-lactamase superfamily II)